MREGGDGPGGVRLGHNRDPESSVELADFVAGGTFPATQRLLASARDTIGAASAVGAVMTYIVGMRA
jgi:hypothetical protein